MNADAVNVESAGTDEPMARAQSGGKPRDPNALKIQLDILLGVAKQEFAEKRFADTLHTSDLILQLDPDNFLALRYAARIHTQNGDVDRAEPFWRRLCATARDKVEPALNVARFAQGRADWETQAEFADLALREDPERLDALRMAIQARVRSKRFDDLSELLPRLYLKEPERALEYLRMLGHSELAPVVAATFKRIAESATESDDALAAMREKCRSAWLVGARRATARREDTISGRYLRAVLAIDPDSREAIEGLEILSRESLINLRKATRKRDQAAAIYHAQIATEINPALVEAWFGLARLVENDDPDHAAEYLRTCAKLAPGDPYYRVRLGRLLRKADRLDGALTAFDQARTLLTEGSDPLSMEVIAAITALRPLVFERARQLSNEGRIREAWAHFEAATRGMAEGGVGAAPAKAFLRTMAAALRKSFKEEEPGLKAHIERFLALEPDNKDVLSLLATAQMRDRHFDQARESLLRLTQLSPDGLSAYVRLARCCHALGRREEGVEAANAALRLDPTSPTALEAAALFASAPGAPGDSANGSLS
jgi:tetratricopeptide (TPR) repeat protein